MAKRNAKGNEKNRALAGSTNGTVLKGQNPSHDDRIYSQTAVPCKSELHDLAPTLVITIRHIHPEFAFAETRDKRCEWY